MVLSWTPCIRYFWIVFSALLVMKYLVADDTRYRTRRQMNSIPLVYPYGAIYKLLIGFASPVPNKEKIGLLFAVNFQYQYAQFTNISQLSKYYFVKEVSRELHGDGLGLEGRADERLVFYRSMAGIMSAKGMNGPSCVRRAICEAAQFPVEEEGLVGEILHVLLTPDFGRTPFDDENLDWGEAPEEMSQYTDAAIVGRQMFSCPAVYGECPDGEGLMELISTLRDE